MVLLHSLDHPGCLSTLRYSLIVVAAMLQRILHVVGSSCMIAAPVYPNWVSAIWPLELGNIFAGAERRGRLTQTRVSEFLALIGGLDIEIDDETRRVLFARRSHSPARRASPLRTPRTLNWLSAWACPSPPRIIN